MVSGSSARISRQASTPEPSGQAHVHDDEIGPESTGRLDRLGNGAGLGNDMEPGATFEDRDQPLADDLVVIDDQQAQRAGRRRVGFGHLGSSTLPAR